MIEVQAHGKPDDRPTVIVLHGGPAAPGSAAELARGLAGSFRTLEPWQRDCGDEPLTVARHVADLHEVVRAYCASDETEGRSLDDRDERPALVGHSWGAMLALAYAAEHPGAARAIALVGCGTFDVNSRARMKAIIDERMTPDLRRRMTETESIAEETDRLRVQLAVIDAIYDTDPLPEIVAAEQRTLHRFDRQAHEETWNDMLRCQREGQYPATLASIAAPVLMLHGADDPHPGRMIMESLTPYIPQIEYREFARCGHRPWVERWAREAFFETLIGWLRGAT